MEVYCKFNFCIEPDLEVYCKLSFCVQPDLKVYYRFSFCVQPDLEVYCNLKMLCSAWPGGVLQVQPAADAVPAQGNGGRLDTAGEAAGPQEADSSPRAVRPEESRAGLACAGV